MLHSLSRHARTLGLTIVCFTTLLLSSSQAQDPMVLWASEPYDAPLVGAGWYLPATRKADKLPDVPQRYMLDVNKALASPTIDGRLTEPAWRAGDLRVEGFRYYDSGELEASGARTVARFIRNDDALFIGITCYDRRISDPYEKPDEIRRLLKGDAILVSLDPEANLQSPESMTHFLVPALEGVDDIYLREMPDKNSPWRYAVSITEGRWSVEIRIDWWGMAPNSNFRKVWLANVARLRSGADARGPWSPFLRPTPLLAVASGRPDPFERNSAWALVGEQPGSGKERMPRLNIDVDFTPFLWSLADFTSKAQVGRRFHDATVVMRNETGDIQRVILELTVHTERWKETKVEEITVLRPDEERKVEITYGLANETTHGLSLALYQVKDRRLLRRSPVYPIRPMAPLNEMRLRLAQNERGHASFTLLAGQDMKNARIECDDLIGEKGILFSKWIETRMVTPVRDTPSWRIDTNGRRARWTRGEYESDLLLPVRGSFELEKGQARQFWLTVSSPRIGRGEYSGMVTVQADGFGAVKVPFFVEVTDMEINSAYKPQLAVWGAWDATRMGPGVFQALSAMGFTALRVPLPPVKPGTFDWGEWRPQWTQAAAEAGIELQIEPTLEAFAVKESRQALMDRLSADLKQTDGLEVSLLMPGAPLGSGLARSYMELGADCPWARRGYAMTAVEDEWLNWGPLIDDWHIAGSPIEGNDPSVLSTITQSDDWHTLRELSQQSDRFMMLCLPVHSLSAGEAARGLRATLWRAYANGLDGVTVRPAGRLFEGASGDLTVCPAWLNLTAGLEAGYVTRRLEALADGAEDYALLKLLDERLAAINPKSLRRSERKKHEAREHLLRHILARAARTDGPMTFDSAREKLLDDSFWND